MTYSIPNIITLGSLEYIIDGEIQRAPASEYTVGLRLGAPDYDQREGAFYKNFNDFRGGLGVRVGSAREFPDRYWGSRDVRTWEGSEGDMTLAPALISCTLGAIAPTIPGGTPGPGGSWAVVPAADGTFRLFGATGNKVFSTPGGAAPVFTNVTPGAGPASAQTFSLLYHTSPINNADKGIFWATGASADIWKYNINFGTWSQPSAGRKSDNLIVFDNKLLSVYAGIVSISADAGVTWTDIITMDSATTFAPFWAGIGLDSFGQLMPYLVSRGILYAIDVWTRQAVPLDLGLASSVTAAVVWQDGEVIASDGFYVKAYHPNRPVKNMGFDRDNGTIVQAFIRDFYTVAGKYLLAQVDIGTTLNIYMWDGVGWHVVTGADAIFGPFGSWPNAARRSMVMFNGVNIYNPTNELYILGYSGTTYYVYQMFCDAFKNPLLNGAHKYAGSVDGHIITPWFDGGFAEMDGTAIEFEVHGIFTATEYLQIKYRLDNDTADFATVLGSTNSTSIVHRLPFASGKGISFKNIQFQFLFKRGATNTNTPVVRAIVFKYLKVPRLRSQFTFTVDVEHTARHRGVTEEVVMDTLYATVDDTPLTDFGYVGESTMFVRFAGMPRLDAPRQDGTTKTSTMRVIIEEPI